jgi:hypothetical protein
MIETPLKANQETGMNRILKHIKINKDRSFSRCFAMAILALCLSACASTPQPPTAALQAAESAIADADQARVADYALPELSEARQKLNAARVAVQDQKMILAERLAQESRVDAELASAKTELTKAQAVNDQMIKSIDTLEQEMQRNSGARQ